MGKGTPVEKVEEIALAVKNLEEVVKLYEDLFGMKFDMEWEVPMENMRVKSALIGKTQFHIVESTSSEGVIAKFIQRKGEGIHHICFRVKNLAEMMERLKKGAKLVPEKPVDLGSVRYIFVHPHSTHGVLIELMETIEGEG
ncbi:MAG: VOC family protein [Candidatus Hadarchaeales archaeon]